VLEKIGLTFISKSNSYNKEKWKLSCPWKGQDEITLSWNRTFWPDGISKEDNSVELIVNGVSFGKVNINYLRNQKFKKSLNIIILEEIEKIAIEYTGKST